MLGQQTIQWNWTFVITLYQIIYLCFMTLDTTVITTMLFSSLLPLHTLTAAREVSTNKSEVEDDMYSTQYLFIGMWRSSNLTTFELRKFSTHSKFDKCSKRIVVKCELMENPCSTTDFIRWKSARERRQTFFLKFKNLSHKLQLLNVQHNFCSVMCYTVLI